MWTKEELHEAGLNDFRVFLRQVWDYLRLPEPTPVQNNIAYFVQHGPSRRMVQAFRGVGKSFLTNAYVCFRLLHNPQEKIMIVSAGQQLADDNSNMIKGLIDGMDILSFLRPKVGQRTSNVAFDVGPAEVDKSPSVKSVGITGQLTGSRANLIVSDDVETPKNSMTHTMRERNAELVTEYGDVIKPGGDILYLGTPQVEESLYNRLPTRGYTIRVWPAERPKEITRYHGRVAPHIEDMIKAGIPAGTPTDPDRFDRDELEAKKVEKGKGGYALQYMLDTSPSDIEKHPLKLENLIVSDVDADVGYVKLVWGGTKELVIEGLEAGGFDGDYYHRPAWKSDEMVPWTGTVMAIDPSGQGKDETAYAIVRCLYSQLFLVACGGFLSGYSDTTLNKLARLTAKHRVNEVITERNYGGGMFGSLLEPKIRALGEVNWDPDNHPWHSSQKEVRILQTLDPLFGAHRLIVDRKVIEDDIMQQKDDQQYSLIYQLTRLTRDRGALPHDDRAEALSMACAHWVERMNRDRTEAHKAYKEELRDEQLAKFAEGVLGHRPLGNKWVNTVLR